MRLALGAAIGAAALVSALGAHGAAPRGFAPVAFAAVDANHVWLAGVIPCGGGWCTAVVRTKDGGRSFTRVTAPPLPATGEAFQLVFADLRNGYAFQPGGSLYATHDGGGSWHRTRLSGVGAVATAAGRAYALAGRRLETARVAGGAWRTTRLSFDTENVSAYGLDVWILGSAGLHEKLAQSTDGGRSFAVGAGPCFPGLDGRIEAISSRVLWAFCPTGMMGGAWRSTDGGARFEALSIPHCCVNAASLAPLSAAVAVVASNGGGTGLLRTTDGGATWKRARAPSNAIYSIQFAGGAVGFAIVAVGSKRTRLWKTSDAGASWHSLAIR